MGLVIRRKSDVFYEPTNDYVEMIGVGEESKYGNGLLVLASVMYVVSSKPDWQSVRNTEREHFHPTFVVSHDE